MSLKLAIQTHKLFITDTIQELLADFSKQTADIPLGVEVSNRLTSTLFGGKMLRGSLICLIYQLFSKQQQVPKEVYQVAAAQEICASALLVHDDVMDRDRMRRGKRSVFAEYEKVAEELQIVDAEHYGYSQAMMIGDICFFWVQNIIAGLALEPEIKIELQKTLATESIRTGLGQMLDIDASMLKRTLTQEEIESIALNKTARYSFVLPFLLGATLADTDSETKTKLEQLGNAMGILFQIKDDELGLFGSESETGKPAGNDIKEGKQTLFYYFTKQLLSDHDTEVFNTLYGTDVDERELRIVRKLVESSGAFDTVQALLAQYAKKSKSLIEELPIEDDYKSSLYDFVEYNVTRNR